MTCSRSESRRQDIAAQRAFLQGRRRRQGPHADRRHRRQPGGRGFQPRRLHPAIHVPGPLRRTHLHSPVRLAQRRAGGAAPGDADRGSRHRDE